MHTYSHFKVNFENRALFMVVRSSRWRHLLIISSEPWCLHEEFPLHGKWSLFPSPWVTGFSWWWQVAALDMAAALQRSITMMQISKRHIKMRQKLMNRFWRFWRACWGISMVEALLIAERVRYWTFSMTRKARKSEVLKDQDKGKKWAAKCEILWGSLDCCDDPNI